MAAQVGKYAANVMLKKQMKTYKNKRVETGDDPYFAMIEDPRHPGRTKKVKKQVPSYIPERDANILASVRRRAYRLDMCLFNFLGIRFGWEAVIGLIPFIGDAVGVFFAIMLVRKCMQIDGGLSNTIRTRMMLNIVIDFVVGLVPFVGDLADAAFKCNTRNLRLLEVVLDKKYKPLLRDERDDSGVDREKRRRNRQSGIYMPHDPPPATAFEEFSDEELRDDGNVDVNRQEGANAPPRKQRNSWFGGGRNNRTAQFHRGASHNMSQQETGTVRT